MQLGEMNWPEAGQQTGKVVVVPTGAMEQHGHHLPLLTDTLIGVEVARRAEAELRGEALFLPPLWIGASDHHRSFPGTVSLSAQTYIHVVQELADSLIGGGFRRILLLNSHAGNISPAQVALTQLQIRHRQQIPDLYLTFVSWFDLVPREEIARLADAVGLRQMSISHACEWETSAIQAVRPELVGLERPSTRRRFESAFWQPNFLAPSRVDVFRTLEQSSPTGALGYPEDASPEKGEALLQLAAREVVAFVREFATWPPTLDTVPQD